MNFEEFSQQYDEEWKKFPTDRVNRQIDKHKKKRDDMRKTSDRMMKRHGKGSEAGKLAREKAHASDTKRKTMTAVKNYRTKMTDASKANQKFVGKDTPKTADQAERQVNRASKTPDNIRNNRRVGKNLDSMLAVGRSSASNTDKYSKFTKSKHKDASTPELLGRDYTKRPNSPDYKSDNQRQAEANKSDKEARRKAKSSMTRTNLEKLYKKESMNYSEYLEHLDQAQSPLYKVEGKLPQCPPGYVYSRERKDCIPKTDRDKISGKLSDNKDNKPQAQYNVWGRTGLNGDGYAYEEPFVRNMGDSGDVV